MDDTAMLESQAAESDGKVGSFWDWWQNVIEEKKEKKEEQRVAISFNGTVCLWKSHCDSEILKTPSIDCNLPTLESTFDWLEPN